MEDKSTCGDKTCCGSDCKMTPKRNAYRPPADLKKVDHPEILGDIMRANWSTEGDSDVICD